MHSKIVVAAGFLIGLGLFLGIAQAQSYPAKPEAKSWSRLYTPPVAPDGDNWLDCYLTNVGDMPRNVIIYVRNRNGVEVVPPVRTVVLAGQEVVARAGSKLEPRYCEFRVEGDKGDYRGSAVVQQSDVGTISAVAAE